MTSPDAQAVRRGLRRRLVPLTVVAASISALFVAGAGPASAIDTGGANEVSSAVGLNATTNARLNRKFEQKIAECMKGQAFSYTVVGTGLPADAADGGTSNREAYVKKYGYGISTFFDAAKKPQPDANNAYVAKLSKSDQKAYQLALLGFDPASNADPNAQFTPKSCVGKAFAILGDPTSVQNLIAKVNGLTTRANSDAKVVKALREWSSCMKGAGFTYAKDTDVEPDLLKRLQKVYPTDPSQIGAANSFDAAGLSKLQKLERDTAKADWDCTKKHLSVRDKVLSQLNKNFLTENAAEVAAVGTVIKGK
jgi:hypothetical protein